jgi:hypothetical protein
VTHQIHQGCDRNTSLLFALPDKHRPMNKMNRPAPYSGFLMRNVLVALYFLGVACFASGSNYAASNSVTDAYMSGLANARVTSGALLVSKAGQIVHSQGYGWNSEVCGCLSEFRIAFALFDCRASRSCAMHLWKLS